MTYFEFRADLRAVYQYYCNNLPRPSEGQYPLWIGLPTDSKMTVQDLSDRIDECTGATKPPNARSEFQRRSLANITNVVRIPETVLVRQMQAATFAFRDVRERLTEGRNAFSNLNVRYRGSSDDDALNRGIARFDADPAARAAFITDGEPNGSLTVPVVSIHSMNDPQVPVEGQFAYRENAKNAGKGDLLVQAFTDETAHAAQSAPEVAAAINGLMQWIENGAKPSPQSIAAACGQLRATYEGPCTYHPGYEPRPLTTVYAGRYLRSSSGLLWQWQKLAKSRRSERCHCLAAFGTEPDIGLAGAGAVTERCEQPATKRNGLRFSRSPFLIRD